MLAWAIEAGKELIEVKRSLAHGEFGPWCEANLSFSLRQAQRYIRLAKNDVHVAFEELTEAWAQLNGNRTSSAAPQLDHNTAERLLKFAALADSGNENEAEVAQAMARSPARRGKSPIC